jgi:hypothetical protein
MFAVAGTAENAPRVGVGTGPPIDDADGIFIAALRTAAMYELLLDGGLAVI